MEEVRPNPIGLSTFLLTVSNYSNIKNLLVTLNESNSNLIRDLKFELHFLKNVFNDLLVEDYEEIEAKKIRDKIKSLTKKDPENPLIMDLNSELECYDKIITSRYIRSESTIKAINAFISDAKALENQLKSFVTSKNTKLFGINFSKFITSNFKANVIFKFSKNLNELKLELAKLNSSDNNEYNVEIYHNTSLKHYDVFKFLNVKFLDSKTYNAIKEMIETAKKYDTDKGWESLGVDINEMVEISKKFNLVCFHKNNLYYLIEILNNNILNLNKEEEDTRSQEKYPLVETLVLSYTEVGETWS